MPVRHIAGDEKRKMPHKLGGIAGTANSTFAAGLRIQTYVANTMKK